MNTDVLAGLMAELPEGMVVTDPAVTDGYRQDRAFDPSAGKPLAIIRPRRTEEVQTVLRWASANQVPVVTRGAGSGLSGGATALDGGIVLSTEKMRDITVDPVTRTAVCQPGLYNAEVKEAAAEHGLWYPPDPSSFEICSIGGNIATNAGGLCCVKYGVTGDYVLGMQVVLANGTAVPVFGEHGGHHGGVFGGRAATFIRTSHQHGRRIAVQVPWTRVKRCNNHANGIVSTSVTRQRFTIELV